ncbi:C1 family peptidase [Xanthomonas hyacinthi]|uniref:Peptidase C1 n=1 Tax=Xanthomonas hyacinthi TaxID=56455 RepID=A0A2S7EZ86_9XANT|nr:C1 family peptidase [Xanthomonas hyacinthi]KLD73338.1 peptidase C1 [Xanthomonas hyacinthi DSM 19077]PPU98396.1 peptidase C1 [Xanthomonas hyacinthi]QGY79027.1 C1 family peptidase [Xanthomonas hyacinthi]
MSLHRPIASGIFGLLTLSAFTLAHAQSSHGMGLKPSATVQEVQPLFATDQERAEPLPQRFSLTRWAIEAGDQKQVSSCASWATAHTLSGWYAKFLGSNVTKFAPMYLYTQVNGGGDNGSTMEAPLDVALAQGIATEKSYVQGNYDFMTPPTKAERESAAKHRQPYEYRVIYSNWNGKGGGRALIEQIKAAIANYTPVAIGFYPRQGFRDLSPKNAVDYDDKSPIIGGHEVIALGYDEEGLLIENSWGPEWGKNGMAKLSWRVVNKDVKQAVIAY